jgi:galactose-1-phosphate uridylyltransferase
MKWFGSKKRMTHFDEKQILDYISSMAGQLLRSQDGVKKRELCYQMLVGCLTILPISINQAVHSEKLKDEIILLKARNLKLAEELQEYERQKINKDNKEKTE